VKGPTRSACRSEGRQPRPAEPILGRQTPMQSSLVPSSALLRLSGQQRRVAPRRVSTITRAGLLDFFKAPQAGGRQSGRAQEIVEELLAVTKGTDGGDKASQQLRQQVAELVRLGLGGTGCHDSRLCRWQKWVCLGWQMCDSQALASA